MKFQNLSSLGVLLLLRWADIVHADRQYHGNHGQPYGKAVDKLYNYKSSKEYNAPKNYVKYDEKSYESVTAFSFNESYSCGVIPDTNFELYQNPKSKYGKGVNDVAPYGKYPWIAVITVKNRLVCTGVLIHGQYVLTSSDCVGKKFEKYRVRLGDWDLLTNYNEYEAYQNLDYIICGRYLLPRSYGYEYGNNGKSYRDDDPGYYGPEKYSYQYSSKKNDYSSGLVLLKISLLVNFDKRPQIKPICLPQKSYYHGEESHGSKDETRDENYGYQKHTNCWVVGWYGTKSKVLRNHTPPTKEGPSYTQKYNYYQKYYKRTDKSLIQKRAKVKRVKCPKSYAKSDYSDSLCFVGVEGYDSCVADRGAAVFCVIPENVYGNYEAGYTKDSKYYSNGPFDGKRYPLEGTHDDDVYSHKYPGDDEDYSEDEGPYQGAYHEKKVYRNKEIRAHPSGPKSVRYRAVLIAIVEKTAKCSKKSYKSYGKQSRIIKAMKVDKSAVRSIIDIFWEIHGDDTCPVPVAAYPEPEVVYKQGYDNYDNKCRHKSKQECYESYKQRSYDKEDSYDNFDGPKSKNYHGSKDEDGYKNRDRSTYENYGYRHHSYENDDPSDRHGYYRRPQYNEYRNYDDNEDSYYEHKLDYTKY